MIFLLIVAFLFGTDDSERFPGVDEIVRHALEAPEKPFTSGSWTVSFARQSEIVGDCSATTWIVSTKAKNGWEYASFLDMSNGCGDGFKIHLSEEQLTKCPEKDDSCTFLMHLGMVHELRRSTKERE